MRTLLVAVVCTLLSGCIAVPHAEPWAPLQISVDAAVVHPENEIFVYVNDVYRGNLVDGRFRIYLNLEAHDLRVHFPGHEPVEQRIVLTPADYPGGLQLVIAPPAETAD